MEFLLGLALSTHIGFSGDYNETNPHFRFETAEFAGGA